MKSILLSLLGLLLCGCVHEQVASTRRAIDCIQAGKDVNWNGVSLRVAERDGDAIGGIRIVTKTPEGQDQILTADKGALSPGSFENPADKNCVRVTAYNARVSSGTTSATAGETTIVMRK